GLGLATDGELRARARALAARGRAH
ncbi:MAG: hypothetical protein JWM10_3398, partial [Myxococcaceae bacterium]|nr:hypothetical protein [Myxococcaceae bacterium]